MNAYMPNPKCLSSKTRDRAQILAARLDLHEGLPGAAGDLAAARRDGSARRRRLWNPVRTTLGALQNGAELRPVTSFNLMQGCGKY